MEYLLTSGQMKTLDSDTIERIGVPSSVLMEKAALSVVTAIKQTCKQTEKILVVCGSGNNGGDGVAIGRLLHLQGKQVRIVFIDNIEKATVETKRQIFIAEKYGIKIHNTFDEVEYNVIVDSVFGIGLTRDVEGIYKTAINFINHSRGFKVAVDIPSGISADTGKVMGCAVKADLTVAIAYKKLGHILYPGTEYCNKVIISDIGVYGANNICQNFTFNRDDLNKLPLRLDYSNKGTYGKTLIIAGSKDMAGAAFLAAISAYKVGCGLVRIFTPNENRQILQTLVPEAILTTYDTNEFDSNLLLESISWADVIDIGPGLGMSDTAKQIIEVVLLNRKVPLVVDADGINLLAKYENLLKNNTKNMIITPHIKEMSRICKCDIAKITDDLLSTTIELAQKYNIICVLKDSRTIVADNNKKVYINQSGNNGMATAGSGDVLSGIITGLLAQQMDPFEGAALGVYIHGISGDEAASQIGKYSMMARDIAENIKCVLH
jgi:NAD(P)H-hydrate epimerase